jgi:hypothetical protein
MWVPSGVRSSGNPVTSVRSEENRWKIAFGALDTDATEGEEKDCFRGNFIFADSRGELALFASLYGSLAEDSVSSFVRDCRINNNNIVIAILSALE